MVDSIEMIRFFAEFTLSEAEGLRMTTVAISPITTQSPKEEGINWGGGKWFEIGFCF
jgi:hypothetical protein